MPPEAKCLVADIDAAFMQQVFDIAKGKRQPDIHLWTPRGKQALNQA